VSPSHSTLATIDGVLINKVEKELICYPCAFKKRSYTIPDSITSIGINAFSDCDSLTSITIPNSITSIGHYAFYNCPNLTLRVKANSYAHQYAIDNSLPYTTY